MVWQVLPTFAERVGRACADLIRRHSVAFLLLLGWGTFCIGTSVVGALYDLSSFFIVTILYVVIAACTIFLYPFLLPLVLRLYHAMHFLFRKSVDVDSSPARTQARLWVSLTLNLSYWVVIYFALWHGILSLVPLASILEGVIPKEGATQLMSTYGAAVLILFLAGSGGPATIYMVTSFRHKHGEDTGRTTIVLLELLCIFCFLYLFLSVLRHAADLGPIEQFGRTFFTFVLSGTFANVAILRLFEKEEGRRRIPLFH